MVTYKKLLKKPQVAKSLIGMSLVEFDNLYAEFEIAHAERLETLTTTRRKQKRRRAAYVRAIELDEFNPIADMARKARPEMAKKTFREASSLRMDAVMYLTEAIKLFGGMGMEEAKRIGFEIPKVRRSAIISIRLTGTSNCL